MSTSPTIASLFETCNDMGAGFVQQIFGDEDGNPIAYVLACVEPAFIPHLQLIVDAWSEAEGETLPALINAMLDKLCEDVRLFEIVEGGEIYAAYTEADVKALWQSYNPEDNTDEIYEASDVSGDEDYLDLLKKALLTGATLPAQIATSYA